MISFSRPTIGLALSGSGYRTAFYIGFLEALRRQDVPIDYITACSGGSLVAAAFACGTLDEFREEVLSLDTKKIKKYFAKSAGKGGLYSLDRMEEVMLKYTKGLSFEEVRPRMSFVAVDIESGEQVDLCMGDIAKAARISCTLPGIFEPARWGNRILVDGGLLCMVPVSSLKKFPVDITIGVNMGGTKHIFTDRQITLKKAFNIVKKILFIDEIEGWMGGPIKDKEFFDLENKPGFFSVVGKSLDLAIDANKKNVGLDQCDLMITLNLPGLSRNIFTQFNPFYELGKETALEYAPKIRELMQKKQNDGKPTA